MSTEKSILMAAHRDTGKVIMIAHFGAGKIMTNRLLLSEPNTTGLAFSELEECEQINKTIEMNREQMARLNPSLIFEFSKVKSIDAVMNMLLECRNCLTKEPLPDSKPMPESLEDFVQYLEDYYHPVEGGWKHKTIEGGAVKLTSVWREFNQIS